MKVKEESGKVGLKLHIQKTKIMVSGPITSWEIDGETVETVSDFIFWGSKNHCRSWLQPWNEKTLTPWKESYDEPRQLIKKQKHYFANKGLSGQGYGVSSGHVVRVGWWRKLSAEKLMLLNCGVGEDSWESLVLQGDPASPSWRRSVLGVHWKDWCWSWNSATLATSCEQLTHWKRPWCCEGLGAGGKGDDRGWDSWMASLTWWAWVWINSGSLWWTGRPGVLQFMVSQRVGHDWAIELNWTELNVFNWSFYLFFIIYEIFHFIF